eukprot:TRINITY_DN7159_c0_g1_i2.p1 TRINITY_DN7159_c0_g1~~TRINITY_DN7159_c0_g1_i2.p1  ORF type:complete len:276 (-),score=45.25 TRINITY_DN7159_c0_g1_i2:446-1273(-)
MKRMNESKPNRKTYPRIMNDESTEKGKDHQSEIHGENSNATMIEFFRQAAKELDVHHDRRERLIRLSRDITAESKKIIFLLHRCSGEDPQEIFSKASSSLESLRKKIQSIASELDPSTYWRYMNSFSPGLEEYVEAILFYTYLRENRILSPAEVNSDIAMSLEGQQPQSTSFKLEVPIEIYFGGISDFSGELMRYATNLVAGGQLEKPFTIVDMIRSLTYGSQGLHPGPQLVQKINAMKTNLEKVENLCYTIRVRGSEASAALSFMSTEANMQNE